MTTNKTLCNHCGAPLTSDHAEADLLVRKELEECKQKLALANERAENAMRNKNAFLNNMSHEVRTPLSAIIGFTELSLSQVDDDRVHDYLNKIMQASLTLLNVVTDIFDISKIESDRLKLRQENFLVADLLNRLAIVMTPRSAEKGLVLRVYQPKEAASMTLCGDSTRLGQILFNLTDNAIKFTEQGSVIVRLELIGDNPDHVKLHFEVEDTGMGLSEDDCKRIFTAFEQADDSISRKYAGTGLGLALCKRLLQIMGGQIGVNSQKGAGSTFWFSVELPKVTDLAMLSKVNTTKEIEAILRAEFSGKRILLVEDNSINQLTLRLHLEQAGLSVDLVEDGKMAIEIAKHHNYDLILMDLQMPNMNGIEATKVIRTMPGYAQTPIVAVTANAFDEDRMMCLEAGMNDHIGKPVLAESLYQTVYRHLSRAS